MTINEGKSKSRERAQEGEKLVFFPLDTRHSTL